MDADTADLPAGSRGRDSAPALEDAGVAVASGPAGKLGLPRQRNGCANVGALGGEVTAARLGG
eukprot:377021-Pyramimonas_sp.AAC.1